MRILSISDLHIGTHARSVDLCPHKLSDEDLIGRDKNFLEEFTRFIKKESSLKNGIDAIIVTGDISNRAHVNEFALAGETIRRIANEIGVKEDKIFFVPGNHDVHWPVMELHPQAYWKKHRYNPLIDGGNFFSERLAASIGGNLTEPPYLSIWQDTQIFVAAINTASHDSPTEAHHHGLVPQAAIEKLRETLKATPIANDAVRICLMHHHPINYSEVSPEYPDLSAAVNAENLLNLLAANSFDMIVHGHKHNPRLTYRVENNSHPCLILGAGSFSSLLDPVNFNGIPNVFHVVEINGRDTATNGIHGSVTSWAYQGGGLWNEKIYNSKLPHCEVFGASVTRHEVVASLNKIISDQIGETSMVRWPSIVAANPILDRVNVGLVWAAFQEVAAKLNCEAVGSTNSPKTQWLILKREM